MFEIMCLKEGCCIGGIRFVSESKRSLRLPIIFIVIRQRAFRSAEPFNTDQSNDTLLDVLENLRENGRLSGRLREKL